MARLFDPLSESLEWVERSMGSSVLLEGAARNCCTEDRELYEASVESEAEFS